MFKFHLIESVSYRKLKRELRSIEFSAIHHEDYYEHSVSSPNEDSWPDAIENGYVNVKIESSSYAASRRSERVCRIFCRRQWNPTLSHTDSWLHPDPMTKNRFPYPNLLYDWVASLQNTATPFDPEPAALQL
jgi:hypothetical protein